MRTLTSFILLSLRTALSAPVPDEYVTWQSEPDIRGTWSIVTSCLTTLVFCVYTALHLNVPLPSRTTWQKFWRTSIWVVAGVFIPEGVVMFAWMQWSEARKLTRDVHALRDEAIAKSIANLGEKHHKGAHYKILESWQIQHSFFVVMGGFQFHPDTVTSLCGSTENKPKAVLTPEGFLNLLAAGHVHDLPLISKQEIQDRSKADYFAKLIALLQGSWFIVQLIGRLAGHLTITELEINTFAHILLAALTYTFWFLKPLTVDQPVWIDPEGLEAWLLLHAALDETAREFLANRLGDGQSPSGTEQSQNAASALHAHDLGVNANDCNQCQARFRDEANYRPKRLVFRQDVTKSPSEVVSLLASSNPTISVFDVVEPASSQRDSMDGDFSEEDALEIDSRGLESLIKLWPLLPTTLMWEARPVYDYLSNNTNMWKSISRSENDEKIGFVIFVSVAYGGLHASIWQHHFPTPTERWLWRISSIIVTAELPVIVFWGILDAIKLSIVRKAASRESDSRSTASLRFVVKALSMIYITWVIATQIVFAFARIFLFVESYISLRSQPPSAYQQPDWLRIIPHF